MADPQRIGTDKLGREVWRLQVSLGTKDKNGRYERVSETFHGTVTMARRRLRALEKARDDGLLASAAAGTVGEWLDEWLAGLSLTQLSARTIDRHKGIVKNHLKPALGDVMLAKLRTADCEKYLTARLVAGASVQTITHERNVLRSAIGHAVRLGKIPHNPVTDVRWKHKVQRETIRALSEDETRTLLAACDGPLHALVYAAVTTGLRRGELLALTWADVDLEAGQLAVRHTLEESSLLSAVGAPLSAVGAPLSAVGAPFFCAPTADSEAATEGLQVRVPKTHRSRRVITLPERTVEVLKGQRRHVREMRLKYGDRWQDNNLVFPALDIHKGLPAGRHWRPSSLTGAFSKVVRKAGFPTLRFHDLRHSHATHLIRAGVPIKDISDRLGHASTAFTMDTYAHVLPDSRRAAAEATPHF